MTTEQIKKMLSELDAWCMDNGKYDRCDQIEWLMENYPKIFKDAASADYWIRTLWGSR